MVNLNYKRHEIGHVFDLPITADAVPGVRLGYKPWAPGSYVAPFHLLNGADTLHLRGRDTLTDVVMPHDSEGNATLVVDASFQSVIFESFHFTGSSKTLIHLGLSSANASEPKPLWVEFWNCTFSTDDLLDGMVKQAIEGHQAGVRFVGCTFKGLHAYEHLAYLRGTVIGPDGHSIAVEECVTEDLRVSELFKSPTRVTHLLGNQGKHRKMDGMWPLREEDGSRANIYVANSFLHRGKRSSMEGGGIVMQDSDKNLLVKNCVIAIDEGAHCIAAEAFTEGVGPDGTTLGVEPAGHPGNGGCLIEDSTLLARPRPGDGIGNMLRWMSGDHIALSRTAVFGVGAVKCDREKDPFGQVHGRAIRHEVNGLPERQRAHAHAGELGWLQGGNAMLDEPTWVGDWGEGS